MKNFVLSILAMFTVSILAGCSPEIGKVKNGYMTDFPEMTTGNLMKEGFDSGSWSCKKENGRSVVTFTGKVSNNLSERAKRIATKDKWAMSYMGFERAYETALGEYHQLFVKENEELDKSDPTHEELFRKWRAAEEKFYADYVKEHCFNAGTKMKISWVVKPDEKTFQLSTGDMATLSIIYGKYGK